MKKIIINERDNVGVCLENINDIPIGHKYALSDVKKGDFIIKYGEIIGRATTDIKKGDLVSFGSGIAFFVYAVIVSALDN